MKRNLIVFEGPDGSGKTTQRDLALGRMAHGGVPVTATRHPGGTETGAALRAIIKNPVSIEEMPGLARRLTFTVDRLTHMAVLKRTLLQEDVLMDRWDGISNRAYGQVEGTSIDEIVMCESIGAEQDAEVDLALIFSVHANVAWNRTDHEDVADSDWTMFQKVNKAYFDMAVEAEKYGFVNTLSGRQIPAVAINANGTKDETHEQVMQAIKRL